MTARATLIVAAAFGAISLVSLSHLRVVTDGRRPDVAAEVLVALACAVLAGWNRWPRSTTAVVVVALTAYVGRGYPNGPVLASGWLAVAGLSMTTTRRHAAMAGTALCVALTGAEMAARGRPTPLPIFFVGWSVAAVLVGDVLRTREQRLAAMVERATFLEQAGEREARRRVVEERLRIARDLHDSVAHGMAAINVQSAAAARVLEHRPDAARDALEAIQQASAQVLDELGAMLTVLRDPGEDADLAPSPGVRDLEKLIEGARHAELDVRLEKRGTVEDIPPAVGTAVFRVVQEALTNAIRYAAGALTSVRIEHDAGRTVAEITSQPAAIGSQTAAVTRSGVGLIGLRERVQAVGGSFVAEATESGAFVVRATWIS